MDSSFLSSLFKYLQSMGPKDPKIHRMEQVPNAPVYSDNGGMTGPINPHYGSEPFMPNRNFLDSFLEQLAMRQPQNPMMGRTPGINPNNQQMPMVQQNDPRAAMQMLMNIMNKRRM